MYIREKLLIITKTYPLPSTSYREHTCVAAINEKGELRRLFPIPFRLLDEDKQFKRWQWISADIRKASDRRPESYNINVESITVISNKSVNWSERFSCLRQHLFENFKRLEEKRITESQSLGIIKPVQFTLEIEEERFKDWTPEEITSLTKEGLFDTPDIKKRPILKKIPYKFYYRYDCIENHKNVQYRHSITDWEVGMLYFNCFKRYGDNWEEKFREKLEREFKSKRDLFFLMGNIHRFQDQWLIVGLIYPPKGMIMQDLLFIPEPGV